jgi:hypothetical protein
MTDEPPSRAQTARRALVDVLKEGFASVKQLSGRTGLSEKQVRDHLEHIARSLARGGDELEREASRCMKCDHRFDDRERVSTPSRCPECRSERISPPRFRIA